MTAADGQGWRRSAGLGRTAGRTGDSPGGEWRGIWRKQYQSRRHTLKTFAILPDVYERLDPDYSVEFGDADPWLLLNPDLKFPYDQKVKKNYFLI